jgi:hypothetical protein
MRKLKFSASICKLNQRENEEISQYHVPHSSVANSLIAGNSVNWYPHVADQAQESHSTESKSFDPHSCLC